MQIPRWRNVSLFKNSLLQALLSSKSVASVATTHVAPFHSTPVTFEKWKNKWNFDERKAQQPSKSYVRYAVRQKRADAKKALKDLLFNSGCPKFSFEDEDPSWKFDGTEERDSDRPDKKRRSRFSGRLAGKFSQKKAKRRFRQEYFSEDFDHPETVFQATFGNKSYTWSPRRDSSFQNSEFEFEWEEKPGWTDQRKWKTMSDTESEDDGEDESYDVGSCCDRTILGLPPTGPLKIEDVKNAFRSSALKWHPDKHPGPSQAMAEEKFKLCVAAYKSLCNALA